MCGTDPWPVKYKAKKYKLHDHFLTKESFHQMMTNLPEYVSEDEVTCYITYILIMILLVRVRST